MKATVKNGQSLLDVAVENFGDREAALDLSYINGVAVTDSLAEGTELQLQEKVYNLRLQQYCRNNNVSPATGL